MQRLLRLLFVLLVARPVTLFVLGLNIRNRERLPVRGPAIVAANHNSHLDTLVLLSLFPLREIHRVRPAAAADYFLSKPWLAWFSRNFIGIVPVTRSGANRHHDPLNECHETLARGDVLIIFPEGTRGEPETMQKLKSGIAHLAMRCPEATIVPVFMHGLGRAMPKGECLLVPFFCDVFVGEPISWNGDRRAFMERLESQFKFLQSRLPPANRLYEGATNAPESES
jgi:1-acyl-sn-glycerol-3-phosphate acyltransferase